MDKQKTVAVVITREHGKKRPVNNNKAIKKLA
jgi:hypothetical protein